VCAFFRHRERISQAKIRAHRDKLAIEDFLPSAADADDDAVPLSAASSRAKSGATSKPDKNAAAAIKIKHAMYAGRRTTVNVDMGGVDDDTTGLDSALDSDCIPSGAIVMNSRKGAGGIKGNFKTR
jgi:hypothetical protein